LSSEDEKIWVRCIIRSRPCQVRDDR